VAGILVAAVGEGWCFFANAVSYLAVLAGLLMMTTPARRPAASTQSALGHAIEGFRFVARTGPIRAILLLVGLVSVAGVPYTALMPVFADRVLGSGATGLGVLMGINGAGALSGALLLAGRESVRGLGRWIAIATGLFSAALLGFALSRSFALSSALLFAVGFGAMIQMGASNTIIQSLTPDHLRGRTLATYSMMLMGMAPIGALVSGLLAERFGAPVTVGAGAVACGIGSALFALSLPSLRQEARALHDAQAAAVPPEVS
jgi:predicted MFS family arabinose efflux permease